MARFSGKVAIVTGAVRDRRSRRTPAGDRGGGSSDWRRPPRPSSGDRRPVLRQTHGAQVSAMAMDVRDEAAVAAAVDAAVVTFGGLDVM